MKTTNLKSAKIYCIAGEASGDFLGASLIKAFQKRDDFDCEIRGVGGELMQTAGAKLLFHYQEIAVMGILEVIPHIWRIKKLIQKTILDIIIMQPDIVVTIDSSGFCNRVIDGVKKESELRGIKSPRFVHYVAPMVWAWRPKRALRLAKRIDHLLCLFSIEPQYFTCHGLDATYVGHPVVELDWDTPTMRLFNDNKKILTLLPGSRRIEIKRHLCLFKDVVDLLSLSEREQMHIVIVTFDRYKDWIQKIIPKAIIVTDQEVKRSVFIQSHFAIAVSGTVSLELALSRTPAIIAYKASRVTGWLMKKFLKIKMVSIPNILLNQKNVPEYLQDDCTAENIVKGLAGLNSEGLQNQQFFDAVRSAVTPKDSHNENACPSQRAANIILGMLENE